MARSGTRDGSLWSVAEKSGVREIPADMSLREGRGRTGGEGDGKHASYDRRIPHDHTEGAIWKSRGPGSIPLVSRFDHAFVRSHFRSLTVLTRAENAPTRLSTTHPIRLPPSENKLPRPGHPGPSSVQTRDRPKRDVLPIGRTLIG